MTVLHAIVAFPIFDAPETIEGIRRAFDPQAALLPAHITLVFPFAAPSDSSFLGQHLATCIAGVPPFDVMLASPSAERDGYLFLRVMAGRDRIVALHDRLYAGPLERCLSTSHPYEPHVTMGRLNSPDSLANALTMARERLAVPLRGQIDAVALFALDDGVGRVELTIPLVNSATLGLGTPPSAPNER